MTKIPDSIEEWYKEQIGYREEEESLNTMTSHANNIGVNFNSQQLNKIQNAELYRDNVEDKPFLQRAGKDILKFGTSMDIFKAIGNAGVDAVNETEHALEDVIGFLGKQIGLKRADKIKIFEDVDEENNYALNIELPEGWKDYKSATGRGLENILQFLAGFVGAGKFIRPLKYVAKDGKIKIGLKAIGKGAVADGAVFDPQEQRLSSLIQNYPETENFITEYLQADPKDTAIEGRFKAFLEGGALGLGAEGLMAGLRVLRGSAKKQLVDEVQLQQAQQTELKGKAYLPPDWLDALGPKLKGRITGWQDKPKTVATEITEKELKARPILGLNKLLNDIKLIDPNLRNINETTDVDQLLTEVLNPRTKIGKEVKASKVLEKLAKRQKSAYKLTKADEEVFKNNKAKLDELHKGRGKFYGKEDYKKSIVALTDHLGDSLEELLERQPGIIKNLTEEKVAAIGFIAKASQRKTGEIVKDIVTKIQNKTITDRDFIIGNEAFRAHALIVGHWRGLGADQARQFRQRQYINDLDDARDLSNIVKTKIEAMAGGNKVLQEKYKKLATLFEANLSIGNLNRSMKEMGEAKTIDRVLEVFINGILSGPKTHIVNALGNTIVIGMRLAEAGIARGYARLLGDDVSIAAGEAFAEADGMVRGFADMMRYYYKTAVRGVGKAEQPHGYDLTNTKLESGQQRAIASDQMNLSAKMDSTVGPAINFIGSAIRIPGAALMHEDAFFKVIGYQMGLYRHSHRQAIQEFKAYKSSGKKTTLDDAEWIKNKRYDILKNIDSNKYKSIRLLASDQAHLQTFTKRVGERVVGLQSTLLRNPALRFIVPFFRTPANILNYVTDRSPLFIFKTDMRKALTMADGYTRADRYNALSKLTMGWLMMAWTFDQVLAGNITGKGNTPRGSLQVKRRMGINPYSVKVGDIRFQYSRTDPIGMTIGMAADMAEMLYSVEDFDGYEEQYLEQFAIGTLTMANNFVSKTYMSGVSELINVISEPDRYSMSYLSRFFGALVPYSSLQREIKRATQPYIKQTVGFMGNLEKNTLGFGDKLPPRRDYWGNEIPSQNLALGDNALGFIYDAVSPIYATREAKNPVDEEFLRLNYLPNKPFSRRQSIGNKRVDMYQYPEDYDRLNQNFGSLKHPRYNGRTLFQKLNSLVSGVGYESKFYQQLDDDDKRTYMSNIIADYRRAAKNIVFSSPKNHKLRHLIRGG